MLDSLARGRQIIAIYANGCRQKSRNSCLYCSGLALLPERSVVFGDFLGAASLALVLLITDSMTPGKILILEDDPDVAWVYEKALREDGNTVTVCSSFEDAREHLRREPPDAVLTDVRVGQYNGLQLAMLFRRQSPAGRIVVVTGYDDTVIRKEVGRAAWRVSPETCQNSSAEKRVLRIRAGASFCSALKRNSPAAGVANRKILILEDDPAVAALRRGPRRRRPRGCRVYWL